MKQNEALYIDELSMFDLEQIVTRLEATMVNAGYDDIRAEYDENTKNVCLTKYGGYWTPVDKQWISTNDVITAEDLFSLLFYRNYQNK